MGNFEGSIPPEILNAFDQKHGFSLLIKGEAGTGKTTLALEILAKKKNAIYISSRVTPESLYNQFPWIKNIPKENIIDGTQIDLKYSTVSHKEAFLHAVKFRNMPDFIKLIYRKAEEIESPEKATIVVDSWDAILGSIVQEWERKNLVGYNETILAELTRQMNINLILIAETDDKSFLDYIVDGIIRIDKTEFDEKRIRILTIEKMRGITIKNFRYLFTLKDGRFHYFRPNLNIKKILDKIEINMKDIEDKITTGIEDFDNLIDGGFSIFSKTLFLIDDTIGDEYSFLIYPLMAEHIKNRKAVIQIPSMELNHNEFRDYFRKNYPEINLDEYYKVFTKNTFDEKNTLELNESIYELISKIEDTFNKYIKEGKTPILFIYGLDVLEILYGSADLCKNWFELLSTIKKIPHISIAIMKDNQESGRGIIYWMDYCFTIFKLHNTLLMYSKKPSTELLGFELKELKKSSIRLNLIPVL
ncbi:MAG: RAD55 family ATPase [Candidatus Helarchaeota archaeon]